jgi:hypothetical protein
MSRKRVGILISGRGSNMSALIEAARAPDYPVEIVGVLSNRAAAPCESDLPNSAWSWSSPPATACANPLALRGATDEADAADVLTAHVPV